jgi:hypothetical protein
MMLVGIQNMLAQPCAALLRDSETLQVGGLHTAVLPAQPQQQN